MFEIIFKYPSTAFAKGEFVLLGKWPVWVLVLLAVVAALAIGALLERRGGRPTRQLAALWGLETALIVLLLFLLWQPALSVAMLKPQQNVVSLVIDDSRSMSVKEDGTTRKDKVLAALNPSLLEELQKKFQVRMYRLSGGLERIEKTEQLTAAGTATRIGENLKQFVAESAALPVGAIVVLTDGSETSGGIDAAAIAEIRRRRIPVHTVGFGNEKPNKDVEISEVELPSRVLVDSRVSARVAFRQTGFPQGRTKLTVRDSGKVLASKEIVFQRDATQQSETITFQAGTSGARNLQVSLEPVEGEESVRNNGLTRLLTVDSSPMRILYIEGEPRWEFKFIRRAMDEDKAVAVVTMLRTTQNKIYRQGIANAKELEEGFPTKPEELFPFSGVIVGGLEANYFTPAQQELLKQFVDRRGGGVLFLAGRMGLAEGGYDKSALGELLPVALPAKKITFFRDPATVDLTGAGRDNLICRLEEDAAKNAARWKKLPYLANFQEVGAPKAGAVSLVEFTAAGHGKFPLLTIQNYGTGRTALLATAGTWRWQMLQPLEDKSHEMFWQQLLRWLVTDTRGRVVASTPNLILRDDGRIPIHARVRDTSYQPAADATVEARIMGPDGNRDTVPLQPDPLTLGEYRADWNAPKDGSYVAEIVAFHRGEEAGREVLTFRREDGLAEDFRLEQNRELLEKLSEQTGGRYYRPTELAKLVEDVAYSEAGITTRETKELWNMPIVLLLILLLRGADWLLRRKWGAV